MEHLFVYGTLRRGTGHPMARFLEENARLVGHGWVAGQLYDLGNFPGLVEAENETDRVRGDLFALKDAETVLQRLDTYEGYDPNSPGPHLFERIRNVVTLDSGQPIEAWIYRYNGDNRSRRIVSGEYRRTDLQDFDWRTSPRSPT